MVCSRLIVAFLALANVMFALDNAHGHSLLNGLADFSLNANGHDVGARGGIQVSPSSDVIAKLQKTNTRLPITIKLDSYHSPDIRHKIQEANTSKILSETSVEINGQHIPIAQVTAGNINRNAKEVGKTMGSFADTLKSITDKSTCNCNPKEGATSVRKVIDATSKLSQDFLSCLIDSLESSINPREATLIRTIVNESMSSLSKSVDGIYGIWKIDSSSRDMISVQTVVDGLIVILNQLSDHLTSGSLSSDENSSTKTLTYVVDSLVKLVANTSEAIAKDVESGLSGRQLEQVMQLAEDLCEPLTSPVLAEFVQGTTRIPYINKLILQYIFESRSIIRSCGNSKSAHANLSSAIFKSLAKGLRSMNIGIGLKNPNGVASQAHRAATTNFLTSLLQQVEDMLNIGVGAQDASGECHKCVGEGLTNIVAIVESVIDNLLLDVTEAKYKQQTKLVGNISKDFANIISVVGSNIASSGANGSISNITNMIYQQFEVLRLISKNDQAIGRNSSGIENLITLLVDVARFEISFVQIAVDHMRSSPDSKLKCKSARDVSLKIIESMVVTGRNLVPANNKPLSDLVKRCGDILAKVTSILERNFSSRPHTLGDVFYELLYGLLDTERKLVSSSEKPSGSGLTTTVPSEIIFGIVNSVRTSVNRSIALTGKLGLDSGIHTTLIEFVIENIVSAEESLDTNGKDNQAVDDSFRYELSQIKNQLDTLLSNGEQTSTTDHYNHSDDSYYRTLSGVKQLIDLLHKLDQLLANIIETKLKQESSIVLRDSKATINVILLLLEDVTRTSQINDGGVVIPGGTLKPNPSGDSGQTETSGISTTPRPSSQKTEPTQNTTQKPTTRIPTPDKDDEEKPEHGGSTGKPGRGGSTGRPTQPDHTWGWEHGHSTGSPSNGGSTGKPTHSDHDGRGECNVTDSLDEFLKRLLKAAQITLEDLGPLKKVLDGLFYKSMSRDCEQDSTKPDSKIKAQLVVNVVQILASRRSYACA